MLKPACLPVWVVGTERQQRLVSDTLRQGDDLALVATERAHGSDLIANQRRRDGVAREADVIIENCSS
jgi:hypothetical protein